MNANPASIAACAALLSVTVAMSSTGSPSTSGGAPSVLAVSTLESLSDGPEIVTSEPALASYAPPRASVWREPRVSIGPVRFQRSFDAEHFLRGNLHTHSNRSDGDSDPQAVYEWYRDHGYQFVMVTDHNKFTNPNRYHGQKGERFLVIGGEEVTMKAAGRQVHVNALCTQQRLPGGNFSSAGLALERGISRVVDSGGIALVNHPNYDWGIRSEELGSAKGARLLEIWSGHPHVHSEGDVAHPSHEAMWDASLTAGLDFMGVAVDDAHHLRPGAENVSRPGRAWVQVFGAELSEQAICSSLSQGLLYASTGPSLLRIQVQGDRYMVVPREPGIEVTFVGSSGKTLARESTVSAGQEVVYRATGAEGYVRARLRARDETQGWTPAVRVDAT